MSYNNKKFLDANGVTQIVGLLDDYATNETLGAVVNSVQTALDQKVSDVQINGTSILQNGVANIPVASNSLGLTKYDMTDNGYYGVIVSENGVVKTAIPTDAQIKSGSTSYKPISPTLQHKSVFYGLAKAAGDTTQAQSDNAIGTYTEQAKAAIQSMLGVSTGAVLIENVTGTAPTITALPNVRYNCGEVSVLTITPPASGSCEIIFSSGSTATTLTVPNTVKWPAWFDAEELDSNMIYDIIITDAAYGAVMSWAS